MAVSVVVHLVMHSCSLTFLRRMRWDRAGSRGSGVIACGSAFKLRALSAPTVSHTLLGRKEREKRDGNTIERERVEHKEKEGIERSNTRMERGRVGWGPAGWEGRGGTISHFLPAPNSFHHFGPYNFACFAIFLSGSTIPGA